MIAGRKARAQTYLLAMIEDGEIFASIDRRDGMVRFHDDPDWWSSILSGLSGRRRVDGMECGVRVERRGIPLRAELMAWSAEWRARSEG